MTASIEIQGLTRKFGPFTAVDDISFRVQGGEVLGFLGPNGAGKSTTMKMVTGFLAPTSGRVSVCGHDVASDGRAAKALLGYLPEGAPAYPDMTPEGFLQFVAGMRGFRGADAEKRVQRAAELSDLRGVMHQRIETLSKGYKRRVGLGAAILHDPPVLVMDEPTDGLDPNQKHEVRQLIRGMAKDKVIVLSTHILEEVQAVCTRAIIIARGRILADGTPTELEAKSPLHNALVVELAGAAPRAREELSAVAGVQRVDELPGRDGVTCLRVVPAGGRNLSADVARLAQGRNWPLQGLTVERGRLEDVFRTITTGGGAAGGAS